MRKLYASVALGALGLGVVAVAGGAQATQFVQNGGFTTLQNGTTVSTEFGTEWSGQDVANWTAEGYTFIFDSPDTTFDGSCGNNCVSFYSLAADNLSGGGGNFVLSDPVFQTQSFALQQSITGLTMGSTYTLSFDYAGAQQTGYTGATTEYWTGSVGSSTFTSPTLNDASQSFTGWSNYVFNFTATAGTELLTFIAQGTPGATVPPFAALDNVSITDNAGVNLLTTVPEPMTLSLFGAGLAGAAALRRRKKAKKAKTG